ncbi:MAG: gamma-glutamylcyclotransferase [Pseudomonadota bacterium]
MDHSLWVFGYGSLMWNPGFPISESVLARLQGYHRSFCMRSIHHRGTETEPGLVLALDMLSSSACDGIAFQVTPGQEEETLAYLRDRELVSAAYDECFVTLDLTDGRRVRALTYVINAQHEQYCGRLPLEEQARIIAHAVGGRGPNAEYLFNTASFMAGLGLHDPDLEWLSNRVRALRNT